MSVGASVYAQNIGARICDVPQKTPIRGLGFAPWFHYVTKYNTRFRRRHLWRARPPLVVWYQPGCLSLVVLEQRPLRILVQSACPDLDLPIFSVPSRNPSLRARVSCLAEHDGNGRRPTAAQRMQGLSGNNESPGRWGDAGEAVGHFRRLVIFRR